MILRWRLGLSVGALAAVITTPVGAQPVNPPKLIVAISVDQFSADLFDQYRPYFTGGLARLAQGAVFRNGFQAHASTETCPGHSTILTGAHPARSGIVGNSWLDVSKPGTSRVVYCIEGGTLAGTGSASGQSPDRVASRYLNATTLGERLKQVSPQSRSVAVAGKDRSAVMMSGRVVDQRWYWEGRKFVTDLAQPQPPASIAAVNAAVERQLATAQAPLEPPPLCAAQSQPVTLPARTVGAGRFSRKAGDVLAFRASPEIDAATLVTAAALFQEFQLGRMKAPDVLAIGLSGTDLVGHTTGTHGQEMCLQLLALDRDLDGFFKLLDSSGVDYAVVLTADHGGDDLPERGGSARKSERADAGLLPATVSKAIAAKLGLAGPLIHGEGVSGDIYLDRGLVGRSRARAQKEAVAAYKTHRQVEAVFTAAEIQAVPMPRKSPDQWSLIERVRASFEPTRSGDFYVILKQDVVPLTDAKVIAATHGTAWDRDRRVPILFWRRGMKPVDRPEAIATVDILPTLAGMVGLPISGEIDGVCQTVEGASCPAR